MKFSASTGYKKWKKPIDYEDPIHRGTWKFFGYSKFANTKQMITND